MTATTVGRVSWLSKSWRVEAAETSLQEALLIGGVENDGDLQRSANCFGGGTGSLDGPEDAPKKAWINRVRVQHRWKVLLSWHERVAAGGARSRSRSSGQQQQQAAEGAGGREAGGRCVRVR